MTPEYRISLSARVAKELETIWKYINKRSPQGAAAMVERILEGIKTLKILPHRTLVEGQDVGHGSPVRSLAVWPYLVFFRVVESEKLVRIVHVRHGARQRPGRFDF